MNTNGNHILSTSQLAKRSAIVFCLLWVATYLLYMPAAYAGKAGDYYLEWLDVIRTHGIKYFMFKTNIPSIYTFTQGVMYICYKLFGAAPLPWHILTLTIHVLNALLLYVIVLRLCTSAAIRHASFIAAGVAILFCCSPYHSEVIVHEPCFHYTIGFLMALLITLLAQSFLYSPVIRYAWWAGIVFFASSFSLEVFYLTPLFVFTIGLYYRNILRTDKMIFKKLLLYFLLPELVMFAGHIALLYAVKHHVVGHDLHFWIGDIHRDFITKAPKYLFHIMAFGRFFDQQTRNQVYAFFDSLAGIITSTSVLALYYILLALLRKKAGPKSWLFGMFFTWALAGLVLICMLAFPDILLVFLDRYVYFIAPFVYLPLLLLVASIPGKPIRLLILCAWAGVSIYFTWEVNTYWNQSAKIISNLIKTFPDPKGKTVLLLNLPENMNGIEMIGSQKASAFKLMYYCETGKEISSPLYDVASYNLEDRNDGAHCMVVYDSLMHVTLNRFGTWWWFNYQGAKSYQNDEYRVNMADVGHWYELILKHPADHYLLLYQVSDQWRVVDWNYRNLDQF